MEVHLVGGGGLDCNQFLLVDGKQAMLVDAGTGLAADATLAEVRAKAGDATVDRIYITHWHADHTGGAPRLARELGAEIIMPEAEAVAVRDGRADLTLAEGMGATQEAHPVTGVEPGQEISLGDAVLEVLHTPGHTAGHTSLWHAESRSLMAGDALFSHGSFGRVDLPTGDAAAMLRTLEELAGLDIRSVYGGHLDIVREGGSKHAELALSNARAMLG